MITHAVVNIHHGYAEYIGTHANCIAFLTSLRASDRTLFDIVPASMVL